MSLWTIESSLLLFYTVKHCVCCLLFFVLITFESSWFEPLSIVRLSVSFAAVWAHKAEDDSSLSLFNACRRWQPVSLLPPAWIAISCQGGKVPPGLGCSPFEMEEILLASGISWEKQDAACGPVTQEGLRILNCLNDWLVWARAWDQGYRHIAWPRTMEAQPTCGSRDLALLWDSGCRSVTYKRRAAPLTSPGVDMTCLSEQMPWPISGFKALCRHFLLWSLSSP